MPFKFGLRKAKRYDVSSKNSYLVCVHLLDGALIECTLTSESTGQDCLENIALRIGLGDTQYFGLRCTNRRLKLFWIDLLKPLKKQLDKLLDKNAHSPLLYFGVMFYVADPLSIQDETARYQYYLNLKADIVDQKLLPSAEQAILLAAYSSQAELGDYDPEKHGPNYLGEFNLLPRTTQPLDDEMLRQLTTEVALLHQQLTGVSQSTAELQFITEAVHADGYGLDYYNVKDSLANDLFLGVSFIGIYVKPKSGQPTVYFKWSDIVNLTHSRRQFGIETTLSDKAFNFYLDDADGAKYLFKICTRQQQFHKSNLIADASVAASESESLREDGATGRTQEIAPTTSNELQQQPQFNDGDGSTPAFYDSMQNSENVHKIMVAQQSTADYSQTVNESAQTVIIHDSVHSDPSHFADNQSQSSSQLLFPINYPSQTSLQLSKHQMDDNQSQTSSQMRFAIANQQQSLYHQLRQIDGESRTSLQRLQCPDVSRGSSVLQLSRATASSVYNHPEVLSTSNQNLITDQPTNWNIVHLPRVPSYRPTPDYETVMRQRMISVNKNNCVEYRGTPPSPAVAAVSMFTNGGPGYGPRHLDLMSYSQPDINNPGDAILGLSYPVAQNYYGYQHPGFDSSYGVIQNNGYHVTGSSYQPSRPVDRSCSLTIYPSGAGRGQPQYVAVPQEKQADIGPYFYYRSPPPYPRQSSSSTPDLAHQNQYYQQRVVQQLPSVRMRDGSSPRYTVRSQLEESMENLSLAGPRGASGGRGGIPVRQQGGNSGDRSFDIDERDEGKEPEQENTLGSSAVESGGNLRHTESNGMEVPINLQPDVAWFREDPEYRGAPATEIPPAINSSYPFVGRSPVMFSDLSRMAVLNNFESQNQYYVHEGRSVPLSATSRAEVLSYLLSVMADENELGTESQAGSQSLESAQQQGHLGYTASGEQVGNETGNSFYNVNGVLYKYPEQFKAFENHPANMNGYSVDGAASSQSYEGEMAGVDVNRYVVGNYDPEAFCENSRVGLVPASTYIHNSPKAATRQEMIVMPRRTGSIQSAVSTNSSAHSVPMAAMFASQNSSLDDRLSCLSDCSTHLVHDASQKSDGAGNKQDEEMQSEGVERYSQNVRSLQTEDDVHERLTSVYLSDQQSQDPVSINCNGMLVECGRSAASVNSDTSSTMAETRKPAPRDERRRALESRLEEGQVFAEFEQIPKKRTKYDCTTATKDINKNRNRFKDVVPYEDNRVRLTPNKANPDGYINASHIKIKVSKEEFLYIAAQGPLPDCMSDFCQMIWENDVEVIAMLTGTQDPDQKKCARYWPDKIGAHNRIKIGDYQVTMKHRNVSTAYVTSVLCFHNTRLNKQRNVWHLQYTDWPDNGCPKDVPHFLEYLDDIEAIRRQVTLERRNRKITPVLVHCTAGVGRTGVVILTEMMKATLEHNQDIDVPAMLRQLREQRMYTVQTVTQYGFVYQLLVLYLQSSRLI